MYVPLRVYIFERTFTHIYTGGDVLNRTVIVVGNGISELSLNWFNRVKETFDKLDIMLAQTHTHVFF